MASGQTSNYKLNQWAAEDKVIRTEFNEDNAKIDVALQSLKTGKGNCKIITGQYTGNGEYDQYHKRTLSFPEQPLMVFIQGNRNCWMIYGSEMASVDGGNTGGFAQIVWSGNTVSWYGYSDYDHLNVAGVTYRYTALIVTE